MSEERSPLLDRTDTDRNSDPCILVIFGATGDLTRRKLMPAIYNLAREGQLPSQFACVAFARREKTDDKFRDEMKEGIDQFSRVKPIEEDLWKHFREQIFYHQSDFDDDAGYASLKQYLSELDQKLGTRGNRIFYLSTQPSYFTQISEKLHKNGLMYDADDKSCFSRVIIEKPFGHDYDSAKALQNEIIKYMDERQIYRIDHYLGKETVQNLLAFRFANSIFESQWNNRYIDHVQITVAEDFGIGTRGRFFEEAGLMRDIVQNHIMQLLTLVAMEPPGSLDADAIRDEKVKVLQSIRPLSNEELETDVIRGQYDKGVISTQDVKAYREEENVDPKSHVETYVGMKVMIDNWRWDGVPFYLRGGKNLPKRVTEIAIVFKDAPNVLFQKMNQINHPNVLAMRIQPDEGIAMRMNCKVPGPSSTIQPVKMDFRYGSYFGSATPDAYERLIKDCMVGDSTLFARQDEVLGSWKLITPILEHWKKTETAVHHYPAGSWGPKESEEMLARAGAKWRVL